LRDEKFMRRGFVGVWEITYCRTEGAWQLVKMKVNVAVIPGTFMDGTGLGSFVVACVHTASLHVSVGKESSQGCDRCK